MRERGQQVCTSALFLLPPCGGDSGIALFGSSLSEFDRKRARERGLAKSLCACVGDTGVCAAVRPNGRFARSGCRSAGTLELGVEIPSSATYACSLRWHSLREDWSGLEATLRIRAMSQKPSELRSALEALPPATMHEHLRALCGRAQAPGARPKPSTGPQTLCMLAPLTPQGAC